MTEQSTVLADSVWPDVPPDALVLVPVGSTEQHGPHLPFDTDTTIASAVARAVVGNALGHPVVVAPAIAYGASGEHQSFPGTVSIGERVLIATVIELARSLRTWAGRVVLVNGHGGNVRAVAAAVAQLRAEGHEIAWIPCGIADGDSHAGRIETSLMLHLDPGRVRVAQAAPGNTAPLADLLPDLVAHGTRSVSANGVLGDPTGASAAEGAALFARIVDEARARLASGAVDGRGVLTVGRPDRVSE